MVKRCLVGALLLVGSDLCLAELGIGGERKIVALESIAILPSKQNSLSLQRMSFGEQRGEQQVNDFGRASSNVSLREKAEQSFIWGLVGNGLGFNKRF